jgi:hypothetical protein
MIEQKPISDLMKFMMEERVKIMELHRIILEKKKKYESPITKLKKK